MCEPTTIALVAGMVLTAGAGLYQADAAKKAGEAQNTIAQRNAELEDYKGKMAVNIGAVAEENHRAKVRQMVGSQRATLAANGVDLGSGTALDLIGETAEFGEADALTIRYNAAREAWGYGTNATNYRTEGSVARTNGRNSAKGTYLTTAASMASMAGGGFGGGATASYGASTGGYGGSSINKTSSATKAYGK
jgi:hypothetical protein